MQARKVFLQPLLIISVLCLMIIVPYAIISQVRAATPDNSQLSAIPLIDPDDSTSDKTLSPYFFVKGGDSKTESLPLKSTEVHVGIAGVIADVNVKQVYINSGKSVIEAIYIFPASTRAAVYSMKMKVGDREIIAKIQEKQKAREEYNQAKSEGKNAALLEQQRPNVFQMNVANIMPSDTVVVEMNYTELLIPENGVYEFVYPTVVGPRYSNKSADSINIGDAWVENPYTHEGEKPNYKFNIDVNLNAGIPLKGISCPSHAMKIRYFNKSSAFIDLKEKETYQGNRDVIIQYKLADNNIESGTLLYKGESENFFLTMIQPPPVPADLQIVPREYIFIMDVSGSMNGYPIETSKKLMNDLIKGLRSTDKFNVLTFAGGSNRFMPQSVFATQENLRKALKMIDEEDGSGSTELLPALKDAMSVPKEPGFSRTFVITTDGYVDVEKEAFTYIRDNLNNANFFAFGIGSSVNRFLIEGIAQAGLGESFVVAKAEDADNKAAQFRKYIESPVLTDINVTYSGFDAYDLEPLHVPDLLAKRPIVLFGKWKGIPSGKIIITGKSGNQKFERVINISDTLANSNNKALRYLWARQRIRVLEDFYDSSNDIMLQKKIINLGLTYNLLTNYTSFIAIDSVVRNAGGKQKTVKQPLPLPQNVNDNAIGEINGTMVLCCMKASCEEVVELESNSQEHDYFIVEEYPEFIGGEAAMREFLGQNIVYPAEAKNKKISGTVYVTFLIQSDGRITDVAILRGIGGGCDEEALRVVKLMSYKFQVNTNVNTHFPVRMNLPIRFVL